MKRDPKGKFARADREFYGVYQDDKKYLRISAGPLRGVRVATLVLEAKLGRKLEHDEDCHHRDGNKLNCAPDNLIPLGHKEHGAVSNKQRMFLKAKEEYDRNQWEKINGPLTTERNSHATQSKDHSDSTHPDRSSTPTGSRTAESRSSRPTRTDSRPGQSAD